MVIKKTLSYPDPGLRLESGMLRALIHVNWWTKSPLSEADDCALQLAFGGSCFCIAARIILMM